MQKIKKIKQGFTMIEIALAMVFISVLSITIVVIIVNAVSSYRRGLTMNDINTGGMSLVDDMKAAIQASPARALSKECAGTFKGDAVKDCIKDGGKSLGLMRRYGNVIIGENGKGTEIEAPLVGVLCTGRYSYIWNSGYFFNKDDFTTPSAQMVQLKYAITEAQKTSGLIKSGFKLLKVSDNDRMVCKKAATDEDGNYRPSNNYNSELNEINITNILIDSEPEDIMSGDVTFSNLALYDLTMATPVKVEGGNNMFYSVSFILGTLQGGPNVVGSGNNCSAPMNYENNVANFDYCAINKFNFAVQAIGG